MAIISNSTRIKSQLSSATGGTITTIDGYKIHTFTGDGTFTPATAGVVEYLIVAGGGGEGGGDGNAGAGGGECGQPATMTWEYQSAETAFDIGARGGSQISKGSQTGNSNYGLAGDRCRGGHGGTIPASGGGGGGYFGGGGGQQDRGGGGGSGYVGGMISGVTVQGNYWEPGGASHPLYPGSSIAYGQQTGGSSPGYHGYVIVQY